MVDGKTVIIDPKEMDEFFSDINTPKDKRRKFTEREQAIIIEAFKRGANKHQTAQKLGTSRETMTRWYHEYLAGGGVI